MKNVRLAWVYPTEREGDAPLAISAISHVELRVSADGGANWAELDSVDAPATQTIIPEVENGAWRYELTIVDSEGRESAPLYAEVTVSDTPPVVQPPKAAKAFSATVVA